MSLIDGASSVSEWKERVKAITNKVHTRLEMYFQLYAVDKYSAEVLQGQGEGLDQEGRGHLRGVCHGHGGGYHG